MTSDRHYLIPRLTTGSIDVTLIGCGGNGAQILMGLASLDVALRATSERHLFVTTVDDDIVSEANLGRQPFYRCDVGRPKAHVLTERVNIAHGLNWDSIKGRAPQEMPKTCDIIISCVDTAAARRAIASHCDNAFHSCYWLDLGNRALDGQFVLGQSRARNQAQKDNPLRLPSVVEHFPELLDESIPETDAPSCSVAEALEKQSLFVNRVVASNALALLWELLGRGSIGYQGQFINLATGQTVAIPLPVPPAA